MSNQGEEPQRQAPAVPSFSSFQAVPTFASFQPPPPSDAAKEEASSSGRKERRSKSPSKGDEERRAKKERREERHDESRSRSRHENEREDSKRSSKRDEDRSNRRRDEERHTRDHRDSRSSHRREEDDRERKARRSSPPPERERERGERSKRPVSGPAPPPPSTSIAKREAAITSLARAASPPLNALKGVFYTQRTGDAVAAQHGGQETSKVPKFNRAGFGTVLGLSRSLRITKETGRSANKALELAPRGKAKRVRYVDPAHAWKAHAASSRRLLPSGEAPDVAGDFVRVSRRAAPVDEEARGGPDYRSLGSGSVVKPPSGAADASDESVSESSGAEDDEAGEDPTAALRANVAVLDARVRANEADIEGWLALARAQAQLARASSALVDEAKKQRSAARVDTGALAKLAAEAQLAVLTKAAKLHPANLRLARARLDIGAQFWERQKVDAEWSRLVDAARLLAAPDVVDVWQSYVTWKASDSGSVAEMVATFAHALKVLRERSWLAQGQTYHAVLELGLVWIWARAVHFLYDAGFHERGFALIQAQLELTYCAPADAQLHDAHGFEAALDSLEAFWDDEPPRLGEEGARGWKAHASGEATEQPPSAAAQAAQPEPIVHTGDAIERWLSMDRERASLRRRPARTTDDPALHAGEQEVDPYALILFSDIRELLVPLSEPRARAAMLDAALTSLGMPPGLSQAEAEAVSTVSSTSVVNGILRDEALSARFWPARLGGLQRSQASDKALFLFEGEVMEPERRSGLDDPYAVPLKLWPPRIDELFPDGAAQKTWFSFVDARDLQSADVEAASLILDDLPAGEGGLSRTLARFAVEEAARGHDDAVTLARGELSVARNNLSLWRAYASLEARAGKVKAARRVYKNALALAPAATSPLRDSQSPALWQAWAELELLNGRPRTAANILLLAAKLELHGADGDAAALEQLSASEQTQPDLAAADVEQAKSFFTRTLSNAGELVGSSLARAVPNMASCAALLEQLTSSGLEAFESACAMFQLALDALEDDEDAAISANSALESLYMSYARYLWRQVSGGAVHRPATVRSALTRAVQRFPSNTAFLSLLAAHEMRSKIEGHLRLTLEKHVLPQLDDALQVGSREDRAARDEIGWIFAIYAELNMSSHNFSPFAVRRLFERAVAEQSSTRYSSVLWQLFLSFEGRLASAAARTAAETKQRQQAQMSDSDDETYERSRKHAHADSRAARAAREQAKRVLYRALQACPFTRELYLAAFAPPLREAMSATELQDLYRTLDERQLRVHVTLDDAVSQEVAGMVRGNEGGAWDEAVNIEEEKEMAERRALMPY